MGIYDEYKKFFIDTVQKYKLDFMISTEEVHVICRVSWWNWLLNGKSIFLTLYRLDGQLYICITIDMYDYFIKWEGTIHDYYKILTYCKANRFSARDIIYEFIRGASSMRRKGFSIKYHLR